MKNIRGINRRDMMGCAAAVGIAMVGVSAWAQGSWPQRPIRVVVGFPPGGGVDVMARTVGIPLGELLGQTIVVENKPGAVGNIAAFDAIRSPADGYTVLIGATYTQTVNPSLIKGSPNLVRDMTPVAIVGRFKYHLVVRPDLGVNNIQELIALARAQPGKLNYASGGQGSQPHLLAEQFQKQTGISMTHIPYKGSGAALQAMLAGEADLVFDPAGSYPHVEAGKLKMLATTSNIRPPKFPNVPTFNEVGIKGMEADAWIGMWVPAATPPEVVERLNKALIASLNNPTVRKKFEDMNAEARYMDSGKFKDLLSDEEKTLSSLIRDRNIRVD